MSSSSSFVPFNNLAPAIAIEREEIVKAALRVIDSGWYVLGPEVDAFEKRLASILQYRNCVGLANGTDAVELALRATVPDGSDVLTVANSAPATAAAIVRAGCRPVFCEIRPDGLMDPAKLGYFLTPATRAVVPVDLYGHPCDLRAIGEFANRHSLALIVDGAQSVGSIHQDIPVDARCVSFYPTKSLGALGDGGAVLTDYDKTDVLVRRLRFYGIKDRARLQQDDSTGCNSRLDEIQAAILDARLGYVDRWCRERRHIAEFYYKHLPSYFFCRPFDEASNYHIFDIRVRHRDWFREQLRAEGVETAVHYPIPAHRQLATERRLDLPMTEDFCETTLSLPCWPGLTEEQLLKVVCAVTRMRR